MKRFFLRVWLLPVALLALLWLPGRAAAENAATSVSLYCTVNADGDCLVSMTVNLHLDSSDSSLMFPLPGTASGITMNGGSVSTTRSGSYIQAALGRAVSGLSGDFSVRFDYTLPGAVAVTADRTLQLTLPLLCGFEYPVKGLDFIITLPGNVSATPSFTSTYQQDSFESNLDLIISTNMITGSTKSGLNDHETVTMTMAAEQSMFPTVSTYIREGNPEIIPMAVCAVLALIYWLVCLRTLPPPRERVAVTPAGIGAGELGCRVFMTGGDLSLMILSWAQLGYVLIRMENGRVLLYKRMEMGNERSLFEVQVFRSLFGKRTCVDAGSTGYARMLRKTAAMVPGERTMVKSRSGSRKIYRLLLCAGQLFCGVCIAMNMTSITVLQVLFAVIFGVLSAISAWFIQDFAFVIRYRYRARFRVSVGLCVFWVALGLIAGQPWVPLAACAVQIIGSYFAAYGGMRTEMNRSEAAEILGLRRYLKNIPRPEAARLLKLDSEYFFRMAPYAIALGVGPKFAAAFSRRKMDQCPYFVTKNMGSRTASEWMRLMLQAVEKMDARARRDDLERWLAIRFRPKERRRRS